MTLRECQSRVSSKEFVLWKYYLQNEHLRFHREDYLFAMVAAEVRRTIVKNPNKVDPKDFLLKFQDTRSNEISEEDKQRALSFDKSFWLETVGLDVDEVLGDEDK